MFIFVHIKSASSQKILHELCKKTRGTYFSEHKYKMIKKCTGKKQSFTHRLINSFIHLHIHSMIGHSFLKVICNGFSQN